MGDMLSNKSYSSGKSHTMYENVSAQQHRPVNCVQPQAAACVCMAELIILPSIIKSDKPNSFSDQRLLCDFFTNFRN